MSTGTTGERPEADRWEILRLVWNFVVHLAVGTFLFVAIALFALGLARFVGWLGHNGMPTALLTAMIYLEFAVFAVDVIAFGAFLYTMLIKFVRELWSH